MKVYSVAITDILGSAKKVDFDADNEEGDELGLVKLVRKHNDKQKSSIKNSEPKIMKNVIPYRPGVEIKERMLTMDTEKVIETVSWYDKYVSAISAYLAEVGKPFIDEFLSNTVHNLKDKVPVSLKQGKLEETRFTLQEVQNSNIFKFSKKFNDYLFVARFLTSGEVTLSYFIAKGFFLCYGLERPYVLNKKDVSAIMQGLYPLRVVSANESPRFKYEHLHVEKVPNRDGIKIHVANKVSDLKGCLATGYSQTRLGVGDSTASLKDLIKYVKDNNINKICVVEMNK